MAVAIGVEERFVLPGIGSIGVSAAFGAVLGWGAWLVVGTVGVVPCGIAFGLWSMVATATGISILGGLAGGMGFETVLVPYVPAEIWLPIFITGCIIRRSTTERKFDAPVKDGASFNSIF